MSGLVFSASADEKSQYFNRLQKLYSGKLAQLLRLGNDRNSLRYLVLQAEADAICQELRHLGQG